MAAAGVEYGLRVTRGRNRTDEGVLSTMRVLLDAGADIEARTLIEPRGESAAHLLVIEQRLSDFSYDYRGRQVPSVRAKPHRTALHGAAMKGFTPIVKFLAENGADLYAKDANGAHGRSISPKATTTSRSCARPRSRTPRRRRSSRSSWPHGRRRSRVRPRPPPPPAEPSYGRTSRESGGARAQCTDVILHRSSQANPQRMRDQGVADRNL